MADKTKKRVHRPSVYGMANEQCVWSRAGVAKPMNCINAFDCLGCAFDHKILTDYEAKSQAKGIQGHDSRPVRFKLMMQNMKCRHMLSGRVDYKLCAHGYNCMRCPYDQMLEDTAYMPNLTPPICDHASGFRVARDHYYHYGHTWARIEYGGRVRIGIDDFASRLFGPADEIETPSMGDRIAQGSTQAIIKRNRNEATTISPVDGTVVAVNQRVLANGSLSGKSPYAEGWLMVIQPKNLRKNLKNLLFGEESLSWMDDEAARLTTLMSDTDGYKLAAAGGEVIDDIYGSVPGLDWQQLVEEFLG
jgi:glycine cleavage system H lipoate-binding protein